MTQEIIKIRKQCQMQIEYELRNQIAEKLYYRFKNEAYFDDIKKFVNDFIIK